MRPSWSLHHNGEMGSDWVSESLVFFATKGRGTYRVAVAAEDLWLSRYFVFAVSEVSF